jgi:hypothetical protein
MALQSARFLLFFAGVLVVSGCGGNGGAGPAGSMVPLGTVQQRPLGSAATSSDRSWLLPEAKSEDLVYTSDVNLNKVFVLSLRTGKLLGILAFSDTPWGLCNDKVGRVFITHFHQYGRVSGEVDEYEHGSSTPVAKMSLPKSESATCSVDPTTGNLAVATSRSPNGPDAISIFSPPLGKAAPQRIGAPGTIALTPYCSYDDHGDLFIMVEQQVGSNYPQWFLDELPSGGKTLVPIKLTGVGGFTQWHGSYLAIGLQNINHVKVSGANGKVVGYTRLSGKRRDFSNNGWGVFWIDRDIVAAPFNYPRSHIRDGAHDLVGAWSYPSGSIIKTSRDFGAEALVGVTISRTPKH